MASRCCAVRARAGPSMRACSSARLQRGRREDALSAEIQCGDRVDVGRMLTGAAVVGVNDGRDVGRTDGRDVGAAVVGVADGRDVGDGLG